MTMEEKIDFLMNAFVEMQEKVDSLMTMQEKVDSLMTMQDKFEVLVEKVGNLEEGFKELRQEQDNTNKTLNLVQKDIKELREEHERMNRTLILIEDDTSNKIPALFDGYTFHQQHIEEHGKRIETLETEVDNHSNRLWVLESSN